LAANGCSFLRGPHSETGGQSRKCGLEVVRSSHCLVVDCLVSTAHACILKCPSCHRRRGSVGSRRALLSAKLGNSRRATGKYWLLVCRAGERVPSAAGCGVGAWRAGSSLLGGGQGWTLAWCSYFGRSYKFYSDTHVHYQLSR